MAEASSPLTSDIEATDHIYQIQEKPGPRGAYEARRVNGGLYVRVDMPGVPTDGVKIFKLGEEHTVTFSGKAPIVWPDCESSGRVYGGYVILDRNPDEIDVQMRVVNGSLKLFFPNSDGILHFFPPKNRPPKHCQAYLKLSMVATAHINPCLLEGEEGVIETKLVADTKGERVYNRIDMPGLGVKNNKVRVQKGVSLFFGGEGSQEHPFDEGGRTYSAGLKLSCSCCKMVDVKHVIKDGVLRVLFRTQTAREIQGKDHVYQLKEKPGPRGAYESRQVNGGLYVRVDMPGVPADGVKIFKRGQAHTVTFTGKAPIVWPDWESSGRVYGGYIVLDRNPDEIDVQMTVLNGSLRLFFPNSDGILHFFPPKNPLPKKCQESGLHIGDDKDCCFNKLVKYLNDHDAVPGYEGYHKDMALHPRDCSCCPKPTKEAQYDAYLESRKIASAHINPYLLDGKEGVVETKPLPDTNDMRMYIRIDMPSLGAKNKYLRVENGVSLWFGGEGSQEHPFDEGGRTYAAGLKLRCTCCKIVDVKHVIKDGVFRVLMRRHIAPGSSGMDCNMSLLN
ncbi:putative 57 kDa heat shock protein [Silene latifolia]|uniref:putative 57 kDa heat shock protein n=1 Tax=Silene latifolia TaxID=37657 RepID=UPI003D788793